MSGGEPKDQARKFLEQLRVMQRENAALWEERIDPDSDAVRVEYRRLMADLAVSERERKKAERAVVDMRRRLEAAGLDPDGAPMTATKSQRKDAINQALAALRKGHMSTAIEALERRAT